MEIGSIVTLAYNGTLEDGTVFGYATSDDPMRFQTGMDMTIDGFEKAVLTMNEVGEKKIFSVDEYSGYGEYIEGKTAVIPFEQVPKVDIKIGQRIWLANDETEESMLCTVLELSESDVTFDLNHPLAGKTLLFDVELLDIQESPEDFASIVEKNRNNGSQSKVLGGDQGESFR